VAASFQRQQQKAALFEAQHEELLKLRAQLHATRATASPSASTLAIENQQQSLEIARLQHEAQQLGGQRVAAERALVMAARAHRELTDRVRALAREVRQFLRLVRAEIRRKFGYVPEAIAHAESWARIAEALDALLRTSGGPQAAAS
jgi:chromosome segregation ATPase